MVIAPHPDDEVLGCGGTIARLVSEGMEVYVLAISVGNVNQLGSNSNSILRIKEFEKSCKFLGIADYEICWVDDKRHMHLDICPLYDLINLIENEARNSINRVKPDILFIPSSEGFNQDHIAVHQAAFTSARPHINILKHTPKVVLGYSIPDESWTLINEKHTVFFDISLYLETKLKAINLYESQLKLEGHPRSIEQIKKLDISRGGEIGLKAAERFIAYRMII